MQAFLTKYIPATDYRESRIKASCERGSIVIGYPHEFSGDEVHREAVRQLIAKFVKEDKKQYGTKDNPWNREFVSGGLPGRIGMAHVFLPYTYTADLIQALELAAATLKRVETKHGPFSNLQGTLDVIWAAIDKVAS